MDNNRAEAERWLGVAERLLASRDLHGTRTFAIRVRDFNPMLADQILAVADTLLAAQSDPIDWYRILQLAPLTQSAELVATQYRKLALLLNPGRNNLLYADQAFRLVSDAWSVLSNPSKKAIYDSELRLGQLGSVSQPGFATQLGLGSPLDQVFQLGQHQQPQPQAPPPQQQQQHHQPQQPQREAATTPVRRSERVIQFGQPQEPQQHQQQQKETGAPVRKSSRSKDGRAALEEERLILNKRPDSTPRTQINQTESTRPSSGNHTDAAPANRQTDSTPSNQATRPKVPSFWTACPYCYVLYEYPKVYEDCTLRCQKCKRAFHAATIPSPPVSENETYFCCWALFPVGFSENAKMAGGAGGGFPSWSPISPMFACPAPGEARENATQGQNKNVGKQSNTKNSAPRVYYDDDDVYVEISDMSDESEEGEYWVEDRRRKQAKTAKGRGGTVLKTANKPQSERVRKGNNLDSGNNLGGGSVVPEGPLVAESSRRGLGNGRRQMRNGAKDLGKLDLNVEFSNEVEEPTTRRREGNGPGYGEEDNIEGNGFFEGLDEFLSSLPILSVVADDKVKAT